MVQTYLKVPKRLVIAKRRRFQASLILRALSERFLDGRIVSVTNLIVSPSRPFFVVFATRRAFLFAHSGQLHELQGKKYCLIFSFVPSTPNAVIANLRQFIIKIPLLNYAFKKQVKGGRTIPKTYVRVSWIEQVFEIAQIFSLEVPNSVASTKNTETKIFPVNSFTKSVFKFVTSCPPVAGTIA